MLERIIQSDFQIHTFCTQKDGGGINIDPLKGSKDLFDKYRPDDINLNIGISSAKGRMKYWCFEEPAFNTMNEDYANKCIVNKWTKLKSIEEIEVMTLEEVFDKFLGNNKTIDMMTIDVETQELDVLSSNNWSKYRPTLIVIEVQGKADSPLQELYEDPAISFLHEKGYDAIAKLKNAVFMKLP